MQMKMENLYSASHMKTQEGFATISHHQQTPPSRFHPKPQFNAVYTFCVYNKYQWVYFDHRKCSSEGPNNRQRQKNYKLCNAKKESNSIRNNNNNNISRMQTFHFIEILQQMKMKKKKKSAGNSMQRKVVLLLHLLSKTTLNQSKSCQPGNCQHPFTRNTTNTACTGLNKQ